MVKMAKTVNTILDGITEANGFDVDVFFAALRAAYPHVETKLGVKSIDLMLEQVGSTYSVKSVGVVPAPMRAEMGAAFRLLRAYLEATQEEDLEEDDLEEEDLEEDDLEEATG